MDKQFKPIPVAIFTFLIAVLAVSGWIYFFHLRSPQIIESNYRWEPFFFEQINRTTDLVEITELRSVRLKANDLEIRIWRFGIPLEGVVLRRVDNVWSATRIKTEGYEGPDKAELIDLSPPESGWERFWQSVIAKGLLELPDASEINCRSTVIDGMVYVVEVNQNNKYRTFMYGEGKCFEAETIREIADLIGVEFDSADEECTRTEWFACAKLKSNQYPK